MNLMIAAHSMNIDTCYIGSAVGAKAPEIMKKLGIPQGYEPAAAVAIGYGAQESAQPAPRREDDTFFVKG